MQAILVRIGVDHSYGGWNSPANPETGEFVYVPIPESGGTTFHPGCNHRYEKMLPALKRFANNAGLDLFDDLRCPPKLLNLSMHLDPDFDYLTYGDVGNRRGSHIRNLREDDLLVFYAGMRPCLPCDQKLIYALVGLFVVDEVVEASTIPKQRFPENAHTRKRIRGKSDIVVRAKPTVSGRFKRFIAIGEYRDRAYRVRTDLLKVWGGLSVNDGYVQRSARPPRFLDAARFRRWLAQQNIDLIAANNLDEGPDPVVIVHLRRPNRGNPNEMRSDPFWEFGSFGCTACHIRNLMSPRRIDKLGGVRLAFAQGGASGFRLVMVTPPVRVVRHSDRGELRWEPVEMPFRYDAAPLLIDAEGNSDFPKLRHMIRTADRTTWPARFSSKFRSRRSPLRTDVAAELHQAYQRLRMAAPPSAIASGYEEAMPYSPPIVDRDRQRTYKRLLNAAGGNRRRSSCRRC